MDRSGLSKLTERERELLRLVAHGHQTDEIARLIGRSPSTIDNHILNARHKLGGVSRREAARMLIAAEHRQGIPMQPLPILDPQPDHADDGGHQPAAEGAVGQVREDRSVFDHRPDPPRPERPLKDRANELNRLPRVALVIVIMASVIAIFGLIFAFSDGVQRWADIITAYRHQR